MRFAKCVLALMSLPTFLGCAQMKSPDDWTAIAPDIRHFTALTFKVILKTNSVQENKVGICQAVDVASGVLQNFDDPDATFAKLKEAALNAINNIPPTTLSPTLKSLAKAVVESGLNVAFDWVRGSYGDLLAKDEARIVLVVSRALSAGMQDACGDVALRSFKVTVQ